MMDAIVFDLDGTLSNCEHRMKYIEGETKNWDAFFEACDQDSPHECMIELFRSAYMQAEKVGIMTGRSESVRKKTEVWLHEHGIDPDFLMMRGEKDFRQDTVMKQEWAMELAETHKILYAVDDKLHMAEMWNSIGIPCILCLGFK